MSYRDESALLARIEELEAENAKLRGRATQPAEIEATGLAFLVGAPTELMIRREIGTQTDDETLRMIGRLMASRLGDGRFSVVGGTLSYTRVGTSRRPVLDIVITPSGEGTYLQLSSSKTGWAVVPWILMFVLAFGFALFAPLRMRFVWWMWPIALVIAVVVGRLAVGPYLRRYNALCIRNVEAFTDIIVRRPRTNVRVAAPAADADVEEHGEGTGERRRA